MILEPNTADDLLLAEAMNALRDDRVVHPKDYRDCVVLKPWGHEFQMFDDKKHAVWMLNIKTNRSTSMHCHQHKMACLIPLVGEITLITLAGRFVLKPLEQVTMMPKAFHCLWNSGNEDAAVIEIESPSVKLDLIRAHDAFGREGAGYEGESHIVRENLEQYGYGRIEDGETLQRFGYDILVNEAGISIRKPVDA